MGLLGGSVKGEREVYYLKTVIFDNEFWVRSAMYSTVAVSKTTAEAICK